MAAFTTFIVVYLLGGLTFLPLLVGLAIYFGTRSVEPKETPESYAGKADASGTTPPFGRDDATYDDGLTLPGDDTKTTEAVRRELMREQDLRTSSSSSIKRNRHDPADDFAASGYFAVYRKFVTVGVNTRPVEPSAVGPEPVAPPSPSVYQTFFRSMLNKKPGPETVVISKAASPRPRNARNMFYVVLRHGYLILFDDDRQVDVRHVIKLADHDVAIYSGSDAIPEGELFIKRNAVRLAPKIRDIHIVHAHNAPTPQPWFFYCENCSDKEDFYFSLLRSQEGAPQPLDIDVRRLTALMERLHASEEAAEMRWLNALVGRLFLGVAKTPDLLRFVEAKVATKLARMPRPNFVSSLAVQRIDIGETTPQITSPRLKSLSAEGECVVEADVRYTGRFEVDLAATMRISMPIGQQEVKTSLAVVLTHLEGHILFKIKAPPSNRIWFSFRQMPKVEMEIRPIVMARQLTWPVFLSMIENKIKEAIADSIVLPFWDDTPFFRTDEKKWRGGLWDEEAEEHVEAGDEKEKLAIHTDGPAPGVPVVNSSTVTDGSARSTGAAVSGGGSQDENASPAVLRLRRLSKTHSVPILPGGSTASADDAGGRRPSNSTAKDAKSNKSRQPSGDDMGPGSLGSMTSSGMGMSPPKRFSRTNTALTAPAEPTTGTDTVHAEAFIPPSSSPKDGKQGSATAMSWLSSNARRHSRSSASSVDVDPAATGSTSNHGREGPVRSRSSRTVASLAANDEDTEVADPIFEISDSEDTLGGKSSRGSAGQGNKSGRATAALPMRAASSTSLHSSASTAPSAIRRKPVELPSATRSTTINSNGINTDGTGDSAQAPPKRTAVLAAAVNDAAISAKRWGINVLQQRRAAAAERARVRARSSSGEPLDLSKPMGGGRPLPPLGEPLPLPHELREGASKSSISGSSAASTTARPSSRDAPPHQQRIHRKPAPSQQQEQAETPPLPRPSIRSSGGGHRRRGSSQQLLSASVFPPEQDLLVVAAPVDDSDSDTGGDEGGSDHSSGLGTTAAAAVDAEKDHRLQEEAALDEPPEDGRQLGSAMPDAEDVVDVDHADEAEETEESEEVDEADDGDDAQWGELAESVISAFLEENGGPGVDEEGEHTDAAGKAAEEDRDVRETESADETAALAKEAVGVSA